MLDSVFNKVAGLKACNIMEKKLEPQLAQRGCYKVTTSWLTLSERCGTVENEICGDVRIRRCNNVAVRRCQGVATTSPEH